MSLYLFLSLSLSLNSLHAFFHRGVCIYLSLYLFLSLHLSLNSPHSFSEVPQDFVWQIVPQSSRQFIWLKYNSKCIFIPSQIEMILPKVFCSQSLALEVEGTGVVIQEMDPGAVNTEMTKVGPGGDAKLYW